MRKKPANEIQLFFHCAACMKNKPPGLAPREWAQIETGFTTRGVQAWCRRCERNIIHIDFEGHQHPIAPGTGEEKSNGKPN